MQLPGDGSLLADMIVVVVGRAQEDMRFGREN